MVSSRISSLVLISKQNKDLPISLLNGLRVSSGASIKIKDAGNIQACYDSQNTTQYNTTHVLCCVEKTQHKTKKIENSVFCKISTTIINTGL